MANHTHVPRSEDWNHKYRCYLHLANQQSQIRQRLSLGPPGISPQSSFSSASGSVHSLSSSPSDSLHSPIFHTAFNRPLSPVSTDPLPRMYSTPASSDADVLLDINRQIKATLTDLLNHPGVRQDSSFSAWVKERLMDTALERRELRKLLCERRSQYHAGALSGSEDEFDSARF